MLKKSETLALITRYLNHPDDETCRMEVEKFRSESVENEAYFKEIEKVWLLSSKAFVLDQVNEQKSVKQFKQLLKDTTPKSSPFFTWFRGVAAAVLLISIGYYWYRDSNEINYIVKSTGINQIDTVKLSDGSRVILAENSELTYPEKFTSLREIQFTKGQAFFNITKDPQHPFKIKMDKSEVTVLGTSFNIKKTSTNITVGVKTGHVMFSPRLGAKGASLLAGQGLSFDLVKMQTSIKTSQNADSWLTKELIFVDTPLEEVCKQLNEYYGTDIKLKSNKQKASSLNATFKNETLEEVLKVLNETYNIKIKKENNQITLITP